VRYTFAPLAPVDFVDLAPTENGAVAYVRFASHKGAELALQAANNANPPLQIDSHRVQVASVHLAVPW
jgi:SOS-response transcriptional repressor LexA